MQERFSVASSTAAVAAVAAAAASPVITAPAASPLQLIHQLFARVAKATTPRASTSDRQQPHPMHQQTQLQPRPFTHEISMPALAQSSPLADRDQPLRPSSASAPEATSTGLLEPSSSSSLHLSASVMATGTPLQPHVRGPSDTAPSPSHHARRSKSYDSAMDDESDVADSNESLAAKAIAAKARQKEMMDTIANDKIFQQIMAKRGDMTDCSPEEEQIRITRLYTLVRQSRQYKKMQITAVNRAWTNDEAPNADDGSLLGAPSTMSMYTSSKGGGLLDIPDDLFAEPEAAASAPAASTAPAASAEFVPAQPATAFTTPPFSSMHAPHLAPSQEPFPSASAVSAASPAAATAAALKPSPPRMGRRVSFADASYVPTPMPIPSLAHQPIIESPSPTDSETTSPAPSTSPSTTSGSPGSSASGTPALVWTAMATPSFPAVEPVESDASDASDDDKDSVESVPLSAETAPGYNPFAPPPLPPSLPVQLSTIHPAIAESLSRVPATLPRRDMSRRRVSFSHNVMVFANDHARSSSSGPRLDASSTDLNADPQPPPPRMHAPLSRTVADKHQSLPSRLPSVREHYSVAPLAEESGTDCLSKSLDTVGKSRLKATDSFLAICPMPSHDQFNHSIPTGPTANPLAAASTDAAHVRPDHGHDAAAHLALQASLPLTALSSQSDVSGSADTVVPIPLTTDTHGPLSLLSASTPHMAAVPSSIEPPHQPLNKKSTKKRFIDILSTLFKPSRPLDKYKTNVTSSASTINWTMVAPLATVVTPLSSTPSLVLTAQAANQSRAASSGTNTGTNTIINSSCNASIHDFEKPPIKSRADAHCGLPDMAGTHLMAVPCLVRAGHNTMGTDGVDGTSAAADQKPKEQEQAQEPASRSSHHRKWLALPRFLSWLKPRRSSTASFGDSAPLHAGQTAAVC
ncbi:hypothetical protein BC831DRAFT_463946 [Entophlyctis helioformis]|nr:hypothetical protein BC831DRAFT_463946 [Entophlyctis helioformis]